MASGIGQVLRDARRGAGASLHDVALQTKIRETYLAALERDDFDALGMDPAYVRGNLRTYADYLGLDAESLVARYSANGGGTPATGARATKVAGRRRRRRWLAPVVGGVLLLAVLGGAALALSGVLRERVLGWGPAEEPARRTEQAAAAVPESGATAPAAGAGAAESEGPVTSVIIPQPPNDAALGANLELKLEFVDLVWIRVIVDGEEEFEGLVKKGTVQEYGADETIEMRIGVADGIEFTVNRAWFGTIASSVDGPVNVVCTVGESCQIAEQQ